MLTLSELWRQMQARPPAPGKFDWRPCVAGTTAVLAAGLLGMADAPARPMLLLRLPRQLAATFTPDYRHQGLRLEPLDSGDSCAYLALILDDDKLTDVFAALAADIVQASSAPATDVARMRAFVQRIEHWEALLRAFNSEGLSVSAQQGLFGELYVLRYLLTQGVAPADALNAWVGPLREAQDFIVSERGAMEVKTLGSGNTVIKVSSAYQLDETPFTRLFLAAVYLGPPDQSGETLPALVAALTASLAAHPAALESLTLRLRQAGYLDVQAARYQATSYAVQALELLQVRDDFPRLRHADLPAAIPALTYSLDLSGLASYTCPVTELLTLFPRG